MKFRSRKLTVCRVCNERSFFSYLNLGSHPPSNSFVEKKKIKNLKKFPLNLVICKKCSLSQLDTIVSEKDIFSEYMYLSSSSTALVQHYKKMTTEILNRFKPPIKSLIVDIGCNDGITLLNYNKSKYRVLGVEPSSVAKIAKSKKIDVINSFFDFEISKKIKKNFGYASIITATNVFAHIDDIQNFVSGIANILERKNGVFVIEFPYVLDMIKNLYFDTIYHEHLSYLSITPLVYLFKKFNMKIFDIIKTEVGASGPSLRIYVCYSNSRHVQKKVVGNYLKNEKNFKKNNYEKYKLFSKKVFLIKKKIKLIISNLKKNNKIVGAFGAPAKGNTLLNYLKLSSKDIKFVCENNKLKIGKFTPGSNIEIVSDRVFISCGIKFALLLSWNYLDFFKKNSEFIKNGGRFIVPFPNPKILQ